MRLWGECGWCTLQRIIWPRMKIDSEFPNWIFQTLGRRHFQGQSCEASVITRCFSLLYIHWFWMLLCLNCRLNVFSPTLDTMSTISPTDFDSLEIQQQYNDINNRWDLAAETDWDNENSSARLFERSRIKALAGMLHFRPQRCRCLHAVNMHLCVL